MFTIEPMICEGTAQHLMWNDQWTATTKDGKRSMLSKYGWYLFAAIAYTGYKAMQEQIKKTK